MKQVWENLRGFRSHIINGIFALGPISYEMWNIISDPNVQNALTPAIPTKYATLYALAWAVANGFMREITTGPSGFHRDQNQ